jgi:hypothetical protein
MNEIYALAPWRRCGAAGSILHKGKPTPGPIRVVELVLSSSSRRLGVIGIPAHPS